MRKNWMLLKNILIEKHSIHMVRNKRLFLEMIELKQIRFDMLGFGYLYQMSFRSYTFFCRILVLASLRTYIRNI